MKNNIEQTTIAQYFMWLEQCGVWLNNTLSSAVLYSCVYTNFG